MEHQGTNPETKPETNPETKPETNPETNPETKPIDRLSELARKKREKERGDWVELTADRRGKVTDFKLSTEDGSEVIRSNTGSVQVPRENSGFPRGKTF